MEDKILRHQKMCQAFIQHPAKPPGVASHRCTHAAIAGTDYCWDHREFAKSFQFSEEFMRFGPDRSSVHNDMLDASAMAWMTPGKREPPEEKVRPWIFNFLYFMIGFGCGLLAVYLFYLLQVMNP